MLQLLCWMAYSMDSGLDLTTLDSLRPARRNMPSAEQHPEVIDWYLEAELRAGRILGPFSPGLILIGQINRLGVVPKGHTPEK